MTVFPPLLSLNGEAEYRAYFESQYVDAESIQTFDGITVQFFANNFNHAFRRDSDRYSRDKAIFDLDRAKRMDWIKPALQDGDLEIYSRSMGNGKERRIVLAVDEKYVVIIQLNPRSRTRARFITAYIVDSESALEKMRSNPPWI